VSDCSEALEKLDEFKPDMVIMDEESLGVGSWSTCSKLRQVLNIPIILMSRDFRDETWMLAVEAGADFYLKKPFSYVELVARVKAILRRYRTVATGERLNKKQLNELSRILTLPSR